MTPFPAIPRFREPVPVPAANTTKGAIDMRICPGDSGSPVTAHGRSDPHGMRRVRVLTAAGPRRGWIATAGLVALSVACSHDRKPEDATSVDSAHVAVGGSDSLMPRDSAVRGTPVGDPAAVPRPSVTIPRSSTDSSARSPQ